MALHLHFHYIVHSYEYHWLATYDVNLKGWNCIPFSFSGQVFSLKIVSKNAEILIWRLDRTRILLNIALWHEIKKYFLF